MRIVRDWRIDIELLRLEAEPETVRTEQCVVTFQRPIQLRQRRLILF